VLAKRGRIVLKGDEYRALVTRCYERDGWRCRRCQNREHLTPHHIIKRSNIRIDTEENLLTLCVLCHNQVEANVYTIIGGNANQRDPAAADFVRFR
jgi:hypothetical protein